ncbi:expressed protein [Chlorella variabilis]|uniref:Expressed protein n=1 Tax=Chlorella variabilis TaxID=554065 RepID=E1ZT06_CHLVA|nr:expressed protein [Chlorella variabilis]EFN50995.1 expressed protein [Chlorella variabilis]|eukprot:XP_005843097.1 expressed protein [Chlorella variabilis]
MSKLQFSRPARRQPLVMLSLLLNMLLLGGSMVWWSGGGLLLGSPQQQGGGGGQVRGAAGFERCERGELDEAKLNEWGCKMFHKACFDQENLLLHSGQKTPDHPNFTHDELFKTYPVPAYVLPGYEEPLGTPHYTPKCWDIDIRGPTPYDPPDVWQPAEFTNCTVPLVWWVTYFSVFGDLYIGGALALDMMQQQGAFDRNVTLAPFSMGMDLPPWYQSLLDPFTAHKVQCLSSLSSREHIRTGQPRCFERALLCNLVGMYTASGGHHWGQLRPKVTGRRTVEHYRRKYPERFLVHEKLAEAENGTVFRVAFQPRTRLRTIVNLDAVVKECKQWKPPADTRFKSVDCVLLPDGTPDNFPDLLAQVQNVHALVNTHGSGNNFAFFMPNGSALVEVLPWNFHGKGCTWADQYFSDWYAIDHSVNSGYFRLVADRNHTFTGVYEKEKRGSSVAYTRDQDVALDFPTLALALERVARGELESNYANHDARTFFMTRRDLCPTSFQFKQEEEARKKEEEEARQKQQAEADNRQAAGEAVVVARAEDDAAAAAAKEKEAAQAAAAEEEAAAAATAAAGAGAAAGEALDEPGRAPSRTKVS